METPDQTPTRTPTQPRPSPGAQWRIKIEVSPSPERHDPHGSPAEVLKKMKDASERGLFEQALHEVIDDDGELEAHVSPVKQFVNIAEVSKGLSDKQNSKQDIEMNHPNTVAMGQSSFQFTSPREHALLRQEKKRLKEEAEVEAYKKAIRDQLE
eukprot:TRINITY_DN2661_c0_g1_i3.p1 TRINITY_DN2661_c0_g1~~TRINITY_DN2661_c0_g1_i3.p1  ORF type:complete len:154 (+),score=41.30 TRINITY_DN2661_c0_g1_i3:227-688(+)